jgi:hypothetical protein
VFDDRAGGIRGSRCDIDSNDRNKDERKFHKGHEGSRLKINKVSDRTEIHATG